MAHDVFRQAAILGHLPCWPNVITVAALTLKVQGEGHVATEQLVRRDLKRLSATHDIVCRKKGKPHGWGLAKGTPAFDGAGMSGAVAILMRVAEAQVGAVLPPLLREAVEYAMEHARSVVAALSPSPAADLPAKIRIVPNGPPLRARTIPAEVVGGVGNALHRGRKIRALYAPRAATEPRPYLLDPLGLLLRGPTIVLVAAEPDGKPRTYLLHRFAEVAIDEEPAEAPPGFDLDTWIAHAGLAYRYSRDPVRFVARFEARMAPEVHELALSDDQTVVEEADGTLLVTATVHDTFELRAWLHGFGDWLEVLEPAPMREAFIANIHGLMRKYGIPKARTRRVFRVSPQRGRGALAQPDRVR